MAARNFVLFLVKLSMVLSEEIHSDFLKIFTSNLDKNNVPPFMKLFWQGTTTMCSHFKKWCPLPSYDDSFLFKFGIEISISL